MKTLILITILLSLTACEIEDTTPKCEIICCEAIDYRVSPPEISHVSTCKSFCIDYPEYDIEYIEVDDSTCEIDN